MYNIALAIGHNFANGDRWAAANNATEADTTKVIIDTIIKKGIPGFNIVKVPEKLGIDERNKWVNARAKDLHAYFEFHLDSATPVVLCSCSITESNLTITRERVHIPYATGCTTFFVAGNDWAKWEAKQYQMEYTRVTGLKGRGIKDDTQNRHGRLGAIRDIKIFGLLMEMWFISNITDLKTIQTKGVEAVTAGIKAMFAS